MRVQETACIASHLAAIYRAVHDTDFFPDSKYALIIEDDVQFEFDIDFLHLIESAPKDFAVLQLMTSNADKARIMFDSYSQQVLTLKKGGVKAQETLLKWSSDDDALGAESDISSISMWKAHKLGEQLWSTQAYIVNKQAVRAYIDSVVSLDGEMMPHVEIKMPSIISKQSKDFVRFPYRIVADIYLYIALGKTYTSRIPLLNGGTKFGYASTISRSNSVGGAVMNTDRFNEKSFAKISAIVSEVYQA
eukprot:gene28882-35829_t